MKKLLPLLIVGFTLLAALFISCKDQPLFHSSRATLEQASEEEENEMYDGPAEADRYEFEKTKDPALGYIPAERLINAIGYTENIKRSASSAASRYGLLWEERGPIFDSVGPGNGNTRGGGGYTSGRMRAVLVDTLNDPSGNTVIIGGVAGGVWKTTNFLSPAPNWKLANDFFQNLSISAFCQDPGNPSTMYFSTGEPVVNADACVGAGLWKSTDAGNTWNRLASTATLFGRTFRLVCDAAGNIYVASRSTTAPFTSTSGLYRSNDQGLTWTNITPNNLTSINAICTDIEISKTGRLHASFGYTTAASSTVNHKYTDVPATVTSATGWNSSTGIRVSNVAAVRMELAVSGNVLYAVTVNSAFNVDSCYKSVDGGATWTKQNTAAYTTGLGSGQGWYALTLSINPANAAEIMIGGLDAYRSTNSGQTITRSTFWVTSLPYVHADHHFMQWYMVNGESRILIGCDGGVYQTRDNVTTWQDKNMNLGIKQFYAADIHPAAGSNYLLAGAQDNGTHAISTSGLTYSKEVFGGDGMFVHINQKNPQVQFGAYVYNQYRRSVDGGQTWVNLNITTASQGMFVNPWDYDDDQNILYGCWGGGQMVRLLNANTNAPGNRDLITITGMTGTPSSFKVSPYTANRVFVGATNGALFRVDNANSAAPVFTNIMSNLFPQGFLNCVNVGSSDQNLVAVFSNYGVNNIWYSNNGGTSWTAIDGNLPDMPVRWAMFAPGNDTRMMIATETGVWTTDAVNGAATVWNTSSSFPTVRTDMLKMRTSDNTVVAATHGRGLFTAVFPTTNVPAISFASAATKVTEDSTGITGCRRYKDYNVNVGIINSPTGDATATFTVQAGNTAIPGVDFDFTTNGSFTSASNQVVFKTDDVSVVPVTIRVYDDAEVESIENFTLGFTISGTTNAVAGSQPTHTFTIVDNDRAPLVRGPLNASVGTYDGTDLGGALAGDLTSPFAATRKKHRIQYLFTANELKAAGISVAAPITSLSVKVKTKNSTTPFVGFTVSIGHTGYTSLNTGFVPEVLTPVYSADYSTVAGINTFNFSTPFQWDGIKSIIVQFCYDKPTADALADVVEGNAAPIGIYRASTYSNYTTSTAPGCSLGAAFIDNARINATFTATVGNSIASTLNTNSTEYLTSNNDLYYYSASGEIIARVKNLSALNYGCTQVSIDRAGTGASQFWNFTPANFLMNKTFQVLPATTSGAGKYEITFYFTKEEKEGWEAATGQSWNNIMLINVPSKVSSVTPLNTPTGIQIVTPVRGTFGTGYTLTGTFDNGFSGFAAGIPGRVNTVLTITGQVNSNGRDIDVNWTTSAEMGSTQFELEKSYDGVNFFKVSTVTAAGTKFAPSNYSYVDREYVQMNYFRVRLLHSDGYTILSNTILVKNDNVPQRLIVLGNPFSNSINIRLSRVSTSKIDFSIYDMRGRLVKEYIASPGTLNISINANSIISKGVYRLRVYIDDYVYYQNLLKL